MESGEKSKLTGKEYYNSLVARAERELSEQLQDQIDRDLPRTFPKHKSIFNTKAGQPVLRRVESEDRFFPTLV